MREVKPQPIADIVDELEYLARRARAGEIVEVAYAITIRGGTTERQAICSSHPVHLIGELTVLIPEMTIEVDE